MRELTLRLIIIAILLALFISQSHADERLNFDVGYIHKWMLTAPTFEGASPSQLDWQDQYVSYPDRNITSGGNGIRISGTYDIYKKGLWSISLGADWSFAKFDGDIETDSTVVSYSSGNGCPLNTSHRIESFSIEAYQVTLPKIELKYRPIRWLELGVGTGFTLNFTNGWSKLTEVRPSITDYSPNGYTHRARTEDNTTDFNYFNEGISFYGIARAHVYGPTWIFAGVRYDNVFGSINETVGLETFKAKLSTVEVTTGITLKF